VKAQMPTVRADGESAKPTDPPADAEAPRRPRQPKDPSGRKSGGGGGGRNRGEKPTRPAASADIE
jgi:hypothetical protein